MKNHLATGELGLAPADAGGTLHLAAYALYYICEDLGGTCQFLRQDIPVAVITGK